MSELPDMSQRAFYRLLGLQIREVSDGRSLVVLPPNPETTNSRGEVHGGVQVTLLDAALINAARSTAGPGAGAMTVSITTNFLAPALGALQARGRVVCAGRSLVTAEATLFDASGESVAQALGTLRVTRPPGS
jgi:uncharacterized protein (TIGR00369 family)